MNARYSIGTTFFIIIFLTSCRRGPVNPGSNPPATTNETLNLTADSVYLFSKEVYYWNDALPEYQAFNPRQYKAATELATAQAVIAAVRNYNDEDKEKKYSYATTYEQAGLTKSGEDIDYGFFVKAGLNFTGPNSFKGWFVNYVYPDSEAGQAGVKRGWKINKIDGNTLTGTQSSVDILNAIFVHNTDSTATFEFVKPDGGTQTNSFSIKKFTANPVLHKEVINTPTGKKVGYVVFNKFFGQSARDALGAAFSQFQNTGIQELILDLRYNGGGVTATQDTLANLIAPQSANGSPMYSYEYNSQLQNNNFPLLKKKFRWPDGFFTKTRNTKNFEIKNTLNLTRIFIIISEATASASELLINNLKPVMNVQLIGDDNTYGKPVGFFGIDLFQKITFYPVSFITKNKDDKAINYTGFTPDKLMYDGVDRDWGETEDCVFAALYYINNGVYPVSRTTQPRSVFQKLKLADKNADVPGLLME